MVLAEDRPDPVYQRPPQVHQAQRRERGNHVVEHDAQPPPNRSIHPIGQGFQISKSRKAADSRHDHAFRTTRPTVAAWIPKCSAIT